MGTLRTGVLVGLWLIGTSGWAQKAKPGSGLGTGLKGEYFAGPNFERKVLTRTDPQVDFNWNWQPPGPGVPREYFSVRWTGKLYAPTSGQYRFSATVDDGVRVWVNGKKVIDEWRKQDDSQFVGFINLMGHQLYDLRIEYYNDWKGSVISVYWESPDDRRLFSTASTPHLPIPAKYLFSKPVQSVVASIPTQKPVKSSTITKRTIRPVATKLAVPGLAFKTEKQPSLSVSPSPDNPPQLKKQALPPVATTAITQPDAAALADQSFTTLKKGDVVVLQHVRFAQSDYTLSPESYTELARLITALQARPTMHVEVAGHTDNVGDKRLNITLSEYRARVVAMYLIRHGIAEERVRFKGYGGSHPVVENGSEWQRAQNRRVEFIVIE